MEVGCAPCDDGRMLAIIRSEFAEMPGMRLTRAQFGRLWHLDETQCASAIDSLLRAGFLEEDRHGRLHRVFDPSA
jgi:hypothetical protein